MWSVVTFAAARLSCKNKSFMQKLEKVCKDGAQWGRRGCSFAEEREKMDLTTQAALRRSHLNMRPAACKIYM